MATGISAKESFRRYKIQNRQNMFRMTLKIVFELSEIISNKLKIKFNMSEKSNRTWSIVLTIVKYAITVVLGALGASNIDQVSNLLTL